MQSFKLLKLARWRQFEEIELDLEPRLCVLTGPNGCGKTTVLNILGRHFGWNANFLSASFVSEEKRRVYVDAWEAMERLTPGAISVGSITYTDGATSLLSTAPQQQAQYQLIQQNQHQVTGLHIPSHRPPPGYSPIQQIPINPKTSQEHYQSFQNFLFATYGEHAQRNPVAAMKEALIAFAVFGEGNAAVTPNASYSALFRGFQSILLELLPPNIGFEAIEIRTPDVILKTKSGHFPLESMSGGINALFGIAWQIHTYGFEKPDCTVLIDEPENHLHPSMQREFLPRLVRAFPTYKFIVASHSPFIVSSEPSATVYALTYNERRRVVSKRLRDADLAGSPNEVLRDILDVPVTMPLWVENRIAAILNKHSGKQLDETVIAAIRQELEAQGLAEALGDFLVQHTTP